MGLSLYTLWMEDLRVTGSLLACSCPVSMACGSLIFHQRGKHATLGHMSLTEASNKATVITKGAGILRSRAQMLEGCADNFHNWWVGRVCTHPWWLVTVLTSVHPEGWQGMNWANCGSQRKASKSHLELFCGLDKTKYFRDPALESHKHWVVFYKLMVNKSIHGYLSCVCVGWGSVIYRRSTCSLLFLLGWIDN